MAYFLSSEPWLLVDCLCKEKCEMRRMHNSLNYEEVNSFSRRFAYVYDSICYEVDKRVALLTFLFDSLEYII